MKGVGLRSQGSWGLGRRVCGAKVSGGVGRRMKEKGLTPEKRYNVLNFSQRKMVGGLAPSRSAGRRR